MTRSEHLQWSKDRALEYLDEGDYQGAYASMVSDLGEHPETAGHIGISLGMDQMVGGQLNTFASMKHFIEGFN